MKKARKKLAAVPCYVMWAGVYQEGSGAGVKTVPVFAQD
jgi:hypothetical protein